MKLDNRSLVDYGNAYVPVFDPPLIVQRHLPISFCKHLVSGLATSPAMSSGVYNAATGSEMVDNYHRSSKALNAPADVYQDALLLINTAVNYHASSLLAKKATLVEPLQFLKYSASEQGHFLAHTDNAYYDAAGKFMHTAPKRHLTCVAYINDDYEGGDFIMHSVKNADGSVFKIKPSIGELIIFPSDIRFLHEVQNVTAGTRYSIVSWFSLK